MKKRRILVLVIAVVMMTAAMTAALADAPSTETFFSNLALVSKTTNPRINNVRLIQEACYAWNSVCRNKLGGSSGIDCVFGSNTKTAVEYFQVQIGTTGDGSCGSSTWKRLNRRLDVSDWSSSSNYCSIYYVPSSYYFEYTSWYSISALEYLANTSGTVLHYNLYGAWRDMI